MKNGNSPLFRTLALLGLFTLTVSCGRNFKSSSLLEANLTCTEKCSETQNEVWSKIELEGQISGGPYGTDGFVVSSVDPNAKTLKFRIPLGVNPFGGAFSVDIPELPGAKASLSQDDRGRWILAIDVPLIYVTRGVKNIPSEKLPNGDPLPGIGGGGELPKIGLQLGIKGAEVDLYIGANALAVFVPTPGFNPYVNLTYQIRNKNRLPIGFFATVAKKAPWEGGFYGSVVLPDEVARLIDSVL